MKSIKDVIKERMDKRLKRLYSAIAICLSYHYDGINVSNYPNEVSNDLVLSLNNTNKINSSILKSLHDEFNNKNKKI